MQCSSACMHCLLHSHYEMVKNHPDEKLKNKYIKEMMKLMSDSPDGVTAPYLSYRCDCLFEDIFNEKIEFSGIKKDFNRFVLEREEDIVKRIRESEDPLKTALVFARIGNYIDFGAMEKVNKDDFLKLFENGEQKEIDEETYRNFIKELEYMGSLLIIADNCGEIVLDRFFAEEVKRIYPGTEITLMVKGKDVLNDATLDDALQAGFGGIAEIVDTGNGIAGCDIKLIGKEAADALDSHSLVLSKGQANFETLFGTGKNIYYSFLCKCDYFAEKFCVEPFSGMFVREKDFSY